MSPRVTVSTDELREIVRDVIREELATFGLRAGTPEQAEVVADNLRFLGTFRRTFDSASATVGKAVLLAIVGLLITAVALGLKMHVLGVASNK